MYKQGIRVKNISKQYNCCTSTIERILERNSTPRNYEYHITQSIETKKKKSRAKNKIGFLEFTKEMIIDISKDFDGFTNLTTSNK